MCHLTIAIDQASEPIPRICNVIDRSAFYIQSIRVVPTAWSRKADLHLSLGGGSSSDLAMLLVQLKRIPSILGMHHAAPEL